MKKAIVIILLLLGHDVACGQGWFELGTGANALNANGDIYTLCTDTSGNIYAAGQLREDGHLLSNFYVAKWNCITHTWSELGTDSNALKANGQIFSIAADKAGNIYAGGLFTDSTNFMGFPIGNLYVAKWNGSAWGRLGPRSYSLSTTIGSVNTMCVDDSGNVYVAGHFLDSFGHTYVAKWNGSAWSELYGLNTGSLFINSICVDDSFNVYAAGDFKDTVGHVYVAKWSNATGLWTELGTGFDSGTYELDIESIITDTPGHVYAALNCDHGGNIFKWNGSAWLELGALNANLFINTLCKGDSGYVYAAGSFTDARGYSYVAQYSPQTNAWEELGTGSNALNPHNGNDDPPINTLCIDKNNSLFAAGGFSDSISVTNDFMYVAEYGINTLAVLSITADYGIKVFPNPATNEINISFNHASVNNVSQYFLIDCMGRICKTGQINRNTDTAIDVSQLTGGIYELSIRQMVFKIIKY